MIFRLLCFFLMGFGFVSADQRSHQVMVSIAPYQFFVNAIAQDAVTVDLIVPPGVSFHHFEPTPKQILEGAKSDVWFRIGESFESRAIPALQAYHPNMKIVDLRKSVDLILIDPNNPNHRVCCQHEGADLHIWLSPKMAIRQVETIANVLSDVYPEHKNVFQQRKEQLIVDLKKLDREIELTLKPLKYRTIMVSHPAYAYFARDYNLEQLPIEYEGKDPSPRQLTNILQEARQKGIKTIFIQNQYSSKGASLLAKELQAKIVELDPYSGDYFNTLREITKRIAATQSDQ